MRYRKDELSALDKIYVATALLIKNNNYNDFNCSTIIASSGVSRSTFYSYFKNKDQVVMYICDDIFNKIFTQSLTKEKNHDFNKDKADNLKAMLVKSFQCFLDEREIVLSILNSNASNIFMSRLRKRLKPFILAMVNKKIIGNNPIPEEIKIHQYINGYTALLQYYLRHGYEISPEKICSYYFQFYK